jgi:hypothetical protein
LRFPLIAKGEEAMARVISMVVKLDDGRYRTIKLHKVKAIYTDQQYMCAGTIESGEDDVAGPPTDKPEFTDGGTEKSFTNGDDGGGEGDDGDGPHCFWLDGVLVCL